MTVRSSLYSVLCVALLFVPACGDDGASDDGEGSSSSGTAGSTGEPATSEAPPETTTGADASGTEEGTTGSGDAGTTTGADGGTEEGSSSSGAPVTCADEVEPKACDAIEGCVWVGNMQMGGCMPDDPAACEGLEMMSCNQHPSCAWDNQDSACNPA